MPKVLWHIQVATGGFNSALRFWQEQLAGYSHPEPLWLDVSNTADDLSFGTVGLGIGSSDLERLRQFAASHSSSAARAVTGIFVRQIMRIVEQPDLLLGVTRKNRRLPGLQDVVGCFFGLMPMRVKASDTEDLSCTPDDASLGDLMQQMNKASKACFEQWAPMTEIAERCRLAEPARSYLSVLVNYRLRGDDDVIRLGSAEAQPLTPLLSHNGRAKVAAHCREGPDSLEINITHRRTFMSAVAAHSLARDLKVSWSASIKKIT